MWRDLARMHEGVEKRADRGTDLRRMVDAVYRDNERSIPPCTNCFAQPQYLILQFLR